MAALLAFFLRMEDISIRGAYIYVYLHISISVASNPQKIVSGVFLKVMKVSGVASEATPKTDPAPTAGNTN
jgi:hypothetical protein